MPRSLSKADENSNISFVLEVKKYPCLYNYTLDEHSKRDVVDACWNKIAKASGDTATNCRERWKNLRTVFVRKRKLPPSRNLYYLNDVMQFIAPYIKVQNNKDILRNLPSPDTHDTETIFICKREEDEEHFEIEDDDTDSGTSSDDERQVVDEIEKKKKKPSMATNKNSGKPKTNMNVDNEKRKATSTFDDVFMEYLQEKRKKINHQSDSARKTFLLSLVPEVDAMTDSQFRRFRWNVLDAIDNNRNSSRDVTPVSIASSSASPAK